MRYSFIRAAREEEVFWSDYGRASLNMKYNLRLSVKIFLLVQHQTDEVMTVWDRFAAKETDTPHWRWTDTKTRAESRSRIKLFLCGWKHDSKWKIRLLHNCCMCEINENIEDQVKASGVFNRFYFRANTHEKQQKAAAHLICMQLIFRSWSTETN